MTEKRTITGYGWIDTLSKESNTIRKKTKIKLVAFVGVGVMLYLAGRKAGAKLVMYDVNNVEPFLKVQFYAEETLKAINDILN